MSSLYSILCMNVMYMWVNAGLPGKAICGVDVNTRKALYQCYPFLEKLLVYKCLAALSASLQMITPLKNIRVRANSNDPFMHSPKARIPQVQSVHS